VPYPGERGNAGEKGQGGRLQNEGGGRFVMGQDHLGNDGGEKDAVEA